MKRITPAQYARAFWEIRSGEGAVDNFVQLLKRSGAWSKRAQIVKEIEKLRAKETGEPRTVVESARELNKDQKEELKNKIGKVTEYKINPDLLAGVRVTVDDSSQLDASLQSIVRKVLN